MLDYRNMYDRNEETGAYLIEINLERYLDFYHEWDSARFKKRDIHPELAEFLKECSEDIPRKESLEIALSVEAAAKDPEQEQCIRDSFLHYAASSIVWARGSIFRLLRNVVLSVVVAVVFLFTAELSPEFLKDSIFSHILTEGFYVGGWVFLWEAVYALAFELPERRHSLLYARRLAGTPLSFRYTGLT